MIGLDLLGVEAGASTDAGAREWGSGGEGDQGPPAPAFVDVPATVTTKPLTVTKPSSTKPAAEPDAPAWANPSDAEAKKKKLLLVGGVIAAIIAGVVAFFTLKGGK